jgi:hypothetical protein
LFAGLLLQVSIIGAFVLHVTTESAHAANAAMSKAERMIKEMQQQQQQQQQHCSDLQQRVHHALEAAAAGWWPMVHVCVL